MRLGPYEIQSALGAGGMGTVYKARDTRLERTVAIKVLSGGPISTPELRQRFEREARAISALQHPNICVLHDVGSQDGLDFLVMEYVDGETVAHRLERGPMPLQQVLKMGVEVANALDKAHRAGLVHRDIKPANIMLTRAGAKLLDFGLAKPIGISSTAAASATTAPAAHSALTTLTQGQPLTQEGMIVGTYQYMAPEQIESGGTDARTDLFALGCVLYEAATGRAAFAGKTQASVIAAILASEPPAMTSVLPGAPKLLERVVRTCLAKDPEDRIHSAHDLQLELEWLLDADVDTVSLTARRRRGVPWLAALATALVMAAAAIAGTVAYERANVEKPIIRASIDLGEGVTVPLVHSSALSPDGKMLAYVAQVGGEKPALWIRTLQSLRARRVDDTDYASYPFWSPDSRSVAFFVSGKLKKLDTQSWSVETICDALDARGGAWNAAGTIVFAPDSLGGLSKVSSSGGQPVGITNAAPNVTHRWPQFLPDGNAFIFLSIKNGDTQGDLLKTSLSDGKISKIATASANTWYTSGRLLFMRGSTLSVEPVNEATLQPTGDPKTIAEDVATDPDRWAGAFTVSDTGLLLYGSTADTSKVQLSWIDINTGKVLDKFGEPGAYGNFALSPDASKVALLVRNPRSESPIPSVMDTARGVMMPILPAANRVRVNGFAWTPDSKSLIFAANLDDPNRGDLYEQPVNSAEPARLLLKMDSDLFPAAVTADGRFLVFLKSGGRATRNDIWLLPLAGERKPVPLVATPADETVGDISRDGRWMLYVSDESGHRELYLTTFPVPHGRWQISTNGSTGGGFEAGGKRIGVVDAEGKIYAMTFEGSGAEPKFGSMQPVLGGISINQFAGLSITPDWKHMAVGQRLHSRAPSVTLVTNWTEELKK
ncbi:MAG: protein kinase domain-containing protein [Terriglobales bacterium]